MRHGKKVAKLGKTASHRKALLKNLCNELFRHKRIVTTLPKAKAARGAAERLLMYAKQGDLAARRIFDQPFRKEKLLLTNKNVDDKKLMQRSVITELIEEIGPKLKELDTRRQAKNPKYTGGGYTRVLKLGQRKGDAANLAILEIVGYENAYIDRQTKAAEEKEAKEKRKLSLAERIKAKKEELQKSK